MAMNTGNFLLRWGTQLTIEWPVRKLTIQELITQLEQFAKQFSGRLEFYSDTQENRNQLSHMIGIERWGQRRLRVALGEPFLPEEYDHYRPSPERTWDELKIDWAVTRQSTVALAHDIAQASPDPDFKVLHNLYGPLSIKGWLRYLDVHASSEGKRIK
jgi:hypothetical protein